MSTSPWQGTWPGLEYPAQSKDPDFLKTDITSVDVSYDGWEPDKIYKILQAAIVDCHVGGVFIACPPRIDTAQGMV